MPISRVIPNEVGPPKAPGDLYLDDLQKAGLGGLTQTQAERRAFGSSSYGVGVGAVGPEKLPGDLYLDELIDPDTQLILNPGDLQSPRLKAKTLSDRASIEAFLAIPAGQLSQVGGPFEEIVSGNYSARDASGTTYFKSIEDFGLSAGEQERFDELVGKGEIDPDSIFGLSRLTSPLQDLVTSLATGGGTSSPYAGFSSAFSALLPGGFGGSGISLQQAIEIVVGNSREGISRYDPTTGYTWDPLTVDKAMAFAGKYLSYQGLPPIAMEGIQIEGGRLLFQLYPVDERVPNAAGEIPQGVRTDNLGTALTLEELTRVTELVSGHSRRVNNPYSQTAPGSQFNETLLYGDFVL